MINKRTIFITSNEPWSPLWFSKHHYANELAKKEHEVYFINPVEKWNLKNLFSLTVKINKEPEGVNVVNYKNNFPVRVFPRLFVWLNDFLNTWKIKRKIKSKPDNIIWWQFDFQRFIWVPFYKKSKRIYHVVDPYMHSRFDRIISRKADLIITVSEKYLQFYKKTQPGKKVIHISHCISEDEKIPDKAIVEKNRKDYGEFVFFAGLISDEIDYKLLALIADNDFMLLMAGKETKLNEDNLKLWKKLLKNKNVRYIGVVSAKNLKNIIAASFACITPKCFNPTKFINAGGALKNLIYLTQKKPVITSIDSGIPELDEQGLFQAKNIDDFVKLLRRAANNDLFINNDLIEKYVKNHYYSEKIDVIFNELSNPKPTCVCYLISRIDKALEFEWAAQYLDKDKIALSFILLNPGKSKLADFARGRQGLPVYEVKYRGKRDVPKTMVKLFYLLRKLKPDILHTHLYDATILGQLTGKLFRIKRRVYTRHHSTFNHVYHPHAVKWDKLVNRLATDIVSISGNVSKVLTEKEKADKNKVKLIPHCIDIEAFSNVTPERTDSLRKKYNLNKNSFPVIGVISRYTHWKGVQYIIPAFEKLLKDYPDACLLLANARQGEYVEEIDALLKKLPKESFGEIRFEPDLFALYTLFDVFVHTPVDDHSEAFGQIYIEALAAKVPSVFTISGIATDFAEHGKNCYIAKHKNSDDIYTGIKTILEDKIFRETILKNGYEYVSKNYALKNKIKKLEELYLKYQ